MRKSRAERPTASQLPAIWSGTVAVDIHVAGAALRCFVEPNGTKLASARDLLRAFGCPTPAVAAQRVRQLATTAANEAELEELADTISKPLTLRDPDSGRATDVYPAALFSDIVHAATHDDGALRRQPASHLGRLACALSESYQHETIVDVIEAATGYRDELRRRLLAEGLADRLDVPSLRRWTPYFPLAYFEELERLVCSPHRAFEVPHRWAAVTIDVLFTRSPEAARRALSSSHPVAGSSLKARAALQGCAFVEHLADMVLLMQASPSAGAFADILERSYPRREQLVTWEAHLSAL